ncbi:glycoside hydrolase family 3 protein [Terrabacter sp. MAHUQ-38]|uniref:glycoside hydrolase family 3 protein n=1 Tax=unclassified Terrabacter TaxID=2630222 RepID=UPI00165E194E|nr:glycoside hydrolase family 3 protein [Terrabacter sp. MAHUQ-38]MBC9820994.1 glycoside hydrolase family 3 C-terminal domain-containing protein [Terrabacter sp. MAHUQ-38]
MSISDPSRRSVLAGGLATAATGVAAGSARAAGTTAPTGRAGEDGWVTATMSRMTLEEKVGQLFIQNVYGKDATAPDSRNLPLYGVASPAEVVQKYHLGGVIYFAWTDSVQDPDQIVRLSNGLQRASLGRRTSAPVPLQVAIDQEQGVVTRIGPPATQFPGSMALGAGDSAPDARTAAAITGRELLAMGVNTNFAPVCDVNVNALNPVIGTRSFSSHPDLAAELAAAQVAGYQRDGGVSSSAKHFPGHGDTATDSHVAFPVITHTREQWESIDAPPFKAAIREGIDMIMTAHLAFPAFDDSGDPATLSRPILTGVLREELGYDGVIVTDSLGMQGVRDRYGDAEVPVRALLAGVDQLLMSPAMDEAYAAVLAAVRSHRIRPDELDEKVRRVLRLKYRRGVVAQPYADPARVASVVGIPAHLAAANAVTARTTTLVKNDATALPMNPSGKKVLVTGYGVSTTATLAAALTAKGGTVQNLQTGSSPTDTQVAAAVAAAADKDVVVVTTMKAWDTRVTDPRGGQQKLVKQLLATGRTVVVVAVRDPYDIAYFTDAPTYVATYSFSPVAVEAAARVITGDVAPTASLPVDIPVADDPATVLYPFGHGLTY